MLYMSNRLCENLIVKFVNENRFVIITINSHQWSVCLLVSTTHWSSLKQLIVTGFIVENANLANQVRSTYYHCERRVSVFWEAGYIWSYLEYKLIGYVQLCAVQMSIIISEIIMRSCMVMSIYMTNRHSTYSRSEDDVLLFSQRGESPLELRLHHSELQDMPIVGDISTENTKWYPTLPWR